MTIGLLAVAVTVMGSELFHSDISVVGMVTVAVTVIWKAVTVPLELVVPGVTVKVTPLLAGKAEMALFM